MINLDPAVIKEIVNNLSKQVQKFVQIGEQPIILASPMVRLYFKRVIEHSVPGLVVLSYNEIDSDIEIQSVGMVSV